MTTMERLNAHNANYPIKDTDGKYNSHYVIAITGELECYYTLYFFSRKSREFGGNPFCYKQNLSTNFDEAVTKMLDREPECHIEVMDYNTLTNEIKRYKSGTFKSGKHAGETFEDVYATDPKYINWYYNWLVEESQKRKVLYNHTYYLTKEQEAIFPIIKGYVEAYHEEQKALRRESIPSAYEEGDRLTHRAFEVFKAERKFGEYGTYVEMRGKCGDKFYLLYPKGFENTDLKELIGKTFEFDSARTKGKEIYGVKYNTLSYVKGLKMAV